MKKHRKLVALLVALTFLFSIVAPAMAATPSEAEKAADKLKVLGIIEGYTDGSLGLDRNITRAEFAKIAVVTAGLKDAAEQLVNFPSQFSDVKVGEWYTGWINMAASQGFVKGDPAGTFRPNDNITYAEVVTVLVRLLGYNDNLTGPWPTNYLAKAVELGITDGVTINASAPAVRGDVFVMTDNTLDCYMVTWSNDEQTWKRRAGDQKLIVKSFKGDLYEGLVTDISWDVNGNVYLDILGYGDNAPSGDMKLAKNAVVTGAKDAFGLLGKNVEFVRNEKETGADKNAIVYLGVKDTETVSKDKAEANYNSSDKIVSVKIDGKTYDVADDFGFTFFPVDDEWDTTWDNKTVDKVEIVLNEDGDAQWGFVYDYSNPDVIEEIDGDKAFGFGNTRIEYDEDDIQVFIKDGVIASYADLDEGDLVYAYEDAKGTDLLVIACSEVLEGELEKANTDATQLTIDGKKINAVANYLVSVDGGDSFDGDIDDVLGEKVKYMLSPVGTVAVVIASTGSSDGLFGMLEYYGNTARGLETRILTPDGSKVVLYVDSDYSTDFRTEVGAVADLPVLVEYTLNSDGKIDEVIAYRNTSVFNDYDGNRAKLNSDWLRVDDNTAFFGEDAGGKLIASDWSTFRGIKSVTTTVYAAEDRGVVKAMYFAGTIAGSDNYGVVADTGRDKNGHYYEIFIDGEKVRYNVTSRLSTANKSLKGKLVEFDLASKKISDIDEVTLASSVYGEVESASTSRILVNNKYYYIDKDTMIVDATGSTIKLVSRVGKGDHVQIHLDEDKGVVKIIRIYKP